MKHIHFLPDLCMLKIFDRVPLGSLTHIGRVCRRWNSLEKSAASRKRTLNLLVYPESDGSNQLSNSGLQLQNFQNSVSQNVINRFPNVIALSICVMDVTCDPFALTNLFIHQWSSKLIELYLIECQLPNVAASAALVKAINSLASLKHLSLEVDDYLNRYRYTFPIIAQLETFSLCVSSHDIDPYEWLSKYAEGNRELRRIELNTPGGNVHEIESMLRLSQELSRKFTSLYYSKDCLQADNSLLERFCAHFTSLEKIKINFYNQTFAERFACLSPLKRLQTIDLNFSYHDPISTLSNFFPFESLVNLNIRIWGAPEKAHKLMDSINFVHIFPNVKFSSLTWYNGLGSCPDFSTEQAIEHYEHMTVSLKMCKHLQEIRYKASKCYRFKWTRHGQCEHVMLI